MKQPQPPANAAELSARLIRHCGEKGYGVTGLGIDKHGYLDFRVSLPGRDSEVVISFNGEVLLRNFRDGYHWSEFAMAPEEETDALADLLAFLDAYAHPATKEVEVKRRLRRTRLELHVSNGAVLRRHGWSKGPPDPFAHAADSALLMHR